MALQYCDYVIGACHPLVYDGKCVFNQDVYEPEVLGGKLIYNRNNPSDSNSRYMRIASGYGPAGKVSEDGGLSIHTAVVAYRT